jgi:thioredoxin 1
MAQYKTFTTMVDEKNKSNANVPDVIHVKSLQHRVDLINNNKVVIVYYHAEWCGPCKTFAPEFNDLAQKYLNKGVLFLKEDVDNAYETPVNITGVPCFHFYHRTNFQNKMTVTGVDKFAIETNLNSLRDIN